MAVGKTEREVHIALTAQTARLEQGLSRADQLIRNFSEKAQRATSAAGGGLQGVVRIGAAMTAVDLIFKTSAVVLDNYSGSARNFSSLLDAFGKTIRSNADELVRAIPVFGQSLGALIKIARGDEIREAQRREAALAARQKSSFDQARRRLTEDFERERSQMQARRAAEGMSDPRARELALLELERKQAVRRVEERFRAAPAGEQSRELRASRQRLLEEIEAEFAARKRAKEVELARKALEEQKKIAEEKAREEERWARQAAEVESQIRQARAKAQGDEMAAQLERIRQYYAEQIAEARKAGQAQLAERLAVLQQLEEAEVHKSQAVKQAAADEKRAQVQARGQVLELAAGTRYAGGLATLDAWERGRNRMAEGVYAGGRVTGRDEVRIFDQMLAGIREIADNTREPRPVVVS